MTFRTIGHMVRALWSTMTSIIMGISRMERCRVRESGEIAREISTLVNGRIIRLTDMAYISLGQATTKVTYLRFRIFLQVCQARRRPLVVQEWRYLQRFLWKWSPKWSWRVLLEGWLKVHRRLCCWTSWGKGFMDQFQRWFILRWVQKW